MKIYIKSILNVFVFTVMVISLPFLYVTFLIFWLIPGLRNLHTKCLISYLLSLAIGNTMIIAINLRPSDYDKVVCSALGEPISFLFEYF